MKKFLKDAMIVSILVTSILMLVLAIGILSPVKHDLSKILHIKLGNGFLTVPRGYLVGVLSPDTLVKN